MIDASSKNCRLSVYKSDFELLIGEDGRTLSSCQSPGFSLLMKQARANFGITKGRFMYEIKILKFLQPQEFRGFNAHAKNSIVRESTKEHKHLVRVGWATQYATTSSALGLDHESCGYENTATRYYTGNYKKYGETFEAGDVIRCCIDLEGHNKSFSFYKNGFFQGIAYRISSRQIDKAYYPTINIRNAEVLFNFGNSELCPIKIESLLISQIPSNASQFHGYSQMTSPFQHFNQQEGVKTVLNVPNAQNLVSKEEVKISEYSFINQASHNSREYENCNDLYSFEECSF